MSRYIIQNGHILHNKKILELGSGIGVCGITAAMYQDSEVILTDYLDSILDVLKENMTLNKNHCLKSMHVKKLDWSNYDTNGEKYEIIIGSELIYSQCPLEKLANLVKAFLDTNGRFLLLMPDERSFGSKFLQIMDGLGFKWEVIVLEDDYYTCSPLEDIPKGERQFYPLKELHFKMYIFRLENDC